MSNFQKLKGAALLAGFLSLFLSLISLPLTVWLLKIQSLADLISPLVCSTPSRLEFGSYRLTATTSNYAFNCLGEDGVVSTATIPSILIICILIAGLVFPFIFWSLLWIKKNKSTQTGLGTPITTQAKQDVPPPEDKIEKMRMLKQMKDADLITAQEYEAKKAEILSEM